MSAVGVDEANRRALKAMSERQWQASVVAHAERRGWLVHYTPDRFHQKARQEGYLHVTKMGDRGFPDLVLVGPRSILYAELKTETGRIRPDQERWRDRIVAAGGEWHMFRPRDLDAVIARLEQG